MDEIDSRPLYEADQVVTIYDLNAIRNGYIVQYQSLPRWRFYRRWLMRIGVGICNEMIHWLIHGKPKGGVRCKGGHND